MRAPRTRRERLCSGARLDQRRSASDRTVDHPEIAHSGSCRWLDRRALLSSRCHPHARHCAEVLVDDVAFFARPFFVRAAIGASRRTVAVTFRQRSVSASSSEPSVCGIARPAGSIIVRRSMVSQPRIGAVRIVMRPPRTARAIQPWRDRRKPQCQGHRRPSRRLCPALWRVLSSFRPWSAMSMPARIGRGYSTPSAP